MKTIVFAQGKDSLVTGLHLIEPAYKRQETFSDWYTGAIEEYAKKFDELAKNQYLGVYQRAMEASQDIIERKVDANLLARTFGKHCLFLV